MSEVHNISSLYFLIFLFLVEKISGEGGGKKMWKLIHLQLLVIR